MKGMVFTEFLDMVESLAQRSGVPVPTLVHAFGPHLLERFYALYPDCFSGIPSALDFLEGIETVIHTEVRKLYPDAQLPEFDCVRTASGLDMVYSSPRHFGDLATGLIEGALLHFGDPVSMTRHDLPNGSIRFEMR